MIEMKGPPLSVTTVERLARYVWSVDKRALVTLQDDGRVTISEIQKPKEVYDALQSLVHSKYRLGGRKWSKFDVQVVGQTK
ncbi:MAG: hypothetical protein UV49_C0031G0019 [candidate division WWE3 bacterium GW2011_GWA2_42_9]|nr:MAG: hypothetical protein UV49_C0031G0019 [candidate division WWE3 bacterium GW2011_GWA2_42_9]